MLDNLSKYKIILASHSPRRKELLSGLDIVFETKTIPDIDESYPEELQGHEIPEYIARKKAEHYRQIILHDELVITADTVVIVNGKVLGKPANPQEAIWMLRSLSGCTHDVITGVCIVTKESLKVFSVTSHVSFAVLGEDEINYYVNKYHPFDKAGAYGIQEWIGYIGVKSLEGSFYNVMGLPVQRLYQELKEL